MTCKSWALVLALGAWTAAGCKASSVGASSPPPGVDPRLQSLVVAGDAATALLPYYDKDTHLYSVVLSSALTTASVTATPSAGVPSVTVSQLGVGTATVAGGTAVPFAVPDPGGTSTVRVVSTTPDGKASAGYTLQLTRRTALGTDGTMASITDSLGRLSFAPATSTYAYDILQGKADGYTLTATTTDPLASLTVNGEPAQSGRPFAPTLTVGDNALTLVVISEDGNAQTTYTLHITVTEVIPVSAITVTSAGNATVFHGLGDTLQLAATVAPADAAQTVTWSSSAPTVASVSSSGLVTSNGIGEVTITATATDGSGVTGSLTLVSGAGTLIFVSQPGAVAAATSSATLTGGTIAVANAYATSGNAFKYVAGVGFYGTNSNGFVSLPFPLRGDFSMTATVAATQSNKANNACGFGLGVTTGFLATDQYAYVFMPATPTTAAPVGTKYVNSATNVSTGTSLAATTFNIGATATPIVLTMSRVGSTYTLGAGSATTTIDASVMSGTSAYGAGPVYPTISFNNVVANVTSLVIRDGAGNVIFDSSTGIVQQYTPASLTLSSPTATVVLGAAPAPIVTATAVQPGGGTASVTATPADGTVVGVAVTNGASSSTLTLTGLRVGSTNVTVTNASDPNPGTNTKTLAVTVEAFSTTDGYGSIAGKVYPAPSATAAYPDGELSVTFDAPPTLNTGGSIDIYDQSSGNLVDRIFFANETQTVTSYATTPASAVPVKVGTQLARVGGSVLYFTPHFGALQYGHSYYVGISTTAVSGTLNTLPFVGFSNLNSVATWKFTTRAVPTLGTTISVDGSQSATTADFHTLGGALMYLAAHPIAGATAVNINVAAGTYTELVNYRAAPNLGLTITISGPAGNTRGDNAVIQYTNGGNLNGQNARASFYFAGANLVLQNLTLRNNGVRSVVAQAETLYFDSRFDTTTGAPFTVAVNNCTFTSLQDTIQTSGRAWFYNSKIEGNVDFIWGTSDAALFENCDLHVINDTSTSPYSIFVARTGTTGASTIGKGYVLLNSRVAVDSAAVAAYGRDAGAGSFYDQVALVNNVFSGSGTLTTGLWVTTTAPLSLGDSTYVGWKASGNTGLGAETASTAPGTASTINSVTTEYDTRNHILNRVVTVSGNVPTGFAGAATTWDTSALATAWGAPNP